MVGTLKLVGEGKWANAMSRRPLPRATEAPPGLRRRPDGLYLTEVWY
jgi:hypothetical protein